MDRQGSIKMPRNWNLRLHGRDYSGPHSLDPPETSARKPALVLQMCPKSGRQKWLRDPTSLPTTVPFRVFPGAIVPKKDKKERDRLVCNGSWSTTRSYAGETINRIGDWIPVASNPLISLPDGSNFE